MAESTDLAALAVSLEPALIEACGCRLSPIEWFRSSWQAGGAATGYATFATDEGGSQPVVVKVPVGPAEHAWTTSIAASVDDGPGSGGLPTPLVYAAGRGLGGYDLAWLVVERFQGPTLSHDMSKRSLLDMLETLAEFYTRTGRIRPVDRPPEEPDWGTLLARARDAAKDSAISGAQHWNKLIHDVQRLLPHLQRIWRSRPVRTWCHGDFHPGNVMRRRAGNSPKQGVCVLLDLGLVHAGHWVEDAVYLERLHWARPEMLCGVKPVSRIAKLMRDRGLHEGEDHATLANIRRVLMASCVPAFLGREGNPAYVQAAMQRLERLLPIVAKSAG